MDATLLGIGTTPSSTYSSEAATIGWNDVSGELVRGGNSGGKPWGDTIILILGEGFPPNRETRNESGNVGRTR